MNLTLREFRVFRVVYELRSFSAASQAVHMTQSAVSKVCQEMEAKVGQRLFERSTRKVVPTQLADQLYGYVCEVLGTMDAAERSLRSLLNLEEGEVRVAASPMMSYGLLRQPVTNFHKAHPGIRIGLHELSTDETIDYVVNGKADFGLVSIDAGHPRLEIEHLYDETMHLVCAAGHALARKRALTWELVAGFPHVSMHPSFSTRWTMDQIYAEKGLSYRSVIEAGTVLSVIGLVKSGLGVTILPGYVKDFVSDLGLVSKPLPAARRTHPISLIRRWNARLSNPAQALIHDVKAFLAASEAGRA
ncbi:LysR family transcriptional regulator [Cupriavidus sp. L7L]|uniref:LysR family transcriptional regulator n=1 Tax=Cupriavidus sp. L7L TaxID=2546443 RepID=UPI001055DC36|nr:LysR family transcriptional regulator [Cupriavidus sp. L7L]TDF64514.1 LysR family transcriptional regulator [Cupriavidus sp. L7L]